MSFIIDNWQSIASTLVGGGGVLAYFSERRKRKAEAEIKESNAFQEMQKAYALFASDMNERYDQMQKEFENVKKKLSEVKKLLEIKTSEYQKLSKKYEELKNKIDKNKIDKSK